MKTETILCDICKEKVAIMKCSFCGKDICEERKCRKLFDTNLEMARDSKIELFAISFCSDCQAQYYSNIISSASSYSKEFRESIREMIIGNLKKQMVVKELKEDGK